MAFRCLDCEALFQDAVEMDGHRNTCAGGTRRDDCANRAEQLAYACEVLMTGVNALAAHDDAQKLHLTGCNTSLWNAKLMLERYLEARRSTR